MNYKTITQEISNSSSIILCLNTLTSIEQTYSIIALIKYLEGLDKKVTLVIITKPSETISSLLSTHSFKHQDSLEGSDYVVTINYGSSGIEKVTYDTDEKSGKIHFHIIPTDDNFNFDNVEMKAGGGKYDLTITLGLSDFKDMGNIYEEHEYLFKENKTLTIGHENIGDMNIVLDEGQTYSYAIYSLLKESKEEIPNEIYNILLTGIVHNSKMIEGNASTQSWKAIGELIESGGDMNNAMQTIYYSKPQTNINMQSLLMKKVQVDTKARVIWSVLSSNDISAVSLDTRGRIPFNISNEYDIAIAAYELKENRIKVVIQSNLPDKYPAKELAGVFEGKGGDSHAVCTVKEVGVKDFNKHFFPVLKDLWGLEVKI